MSWAANCGIFGPLLVLHTFFLVSLMHSNLCYIYIVLFLHRPIHTKKVHWLANGSETQISPKSGFGQVYR